MSEAAKKEGKEDFEAWSDTWLKTAGCNVGTKAPHAYHINYKNYGYAKFKVDKKSLLVY